MLIERTGYNILNCLPGGVSFGERAARRLFGEVSPVLGSKSRQTVSGPTGRVRTGAINESSSNGERSQNTVEMPVEGWFSRGDHGISDGLKN
jgi:hypothetical protein